ncbi:hypothetical protein QWY31_07200 [Cytophagales bacterium LB-30]|uniref:Uncharacterized protein n=1 Tax=Shiella aurantiaca TaxID=3058365 RepID=A0ABT8F4Y2_9BACT|nr:hypothetical protein [Shiella aurantiaca]MDN4165281.1 hypothetical protein [Shiella aurantiaca]
MDIKALNKALVAIAEKKNELSKLSYDHKNYDQVEEELHDMEDDFMEEFGNYLEEALHFVHDEFCSDNDVLLPIAYIANEYKVSGKNSDGSVSYDVDPSQGVIVEADDFPGKSTRLVILPSPPRIILQIGADKKEVVWTADK